jgi:hypothetical protein
VAWTLPEPPEVQSVGLSTGWGSMGEFRVWRKPGVDESYGEAFTLGVPHGAIPGSERAAASIVGTNVSPVARLGKRKKKAGAVTRSRLMASPGARAASGAFSVSSRVLVGGCDWIRGCGSL